MCQANELKCTSEIPKKTDKCKRNCEGLYVSSYDQRKFPDEISNELTWKLNKQYERFKAQNESIKYSYYMKCKIIYKELCI